MTDYYVNKRDIQFCLHEYLNIEELNKWSKFSEFNRETYDMIIDEAIKFSHEFLAPLNQVMDREGVKFKDGEVVMPKAVHHAYKAFCEAGWGSPGGSQEYGGQGLPSVMNAALMEIHGSACLSFLIGPGLTRGAGHIIESFGSEEQKRLYLEKIYSGQWAGTMCLTESSAGSAVGDIKTKAKKDKTGDQYLIEGEKIFISYGDHDLTENIVHPVLARIEGAPKGIWGVSLFLVPKIRVNPDGSLGEPNHVKCGNIEHKMGIHGSPTCTLLFGEGGPCYGTLIGEPHQGIKYMFQMMNEARIGVGLQGLGAAANAYLYSKEYAKERIQGTDVKEMKNADAPRVPIINHPNIRYHLMTMKSFSEGMRAMILWAAKCADVSMYSQDEQEKKQQSYMLDLLTPICKAYCTEWGVEMTKIGMQVYGGYGYISEYPMEQYCRDAVVATIYEGTNDIQALDLLGRKIAGKGGAAFMTYLNHINQFISKYEKDEFAGPCVAKLSKARDLMTQVVMHFQKVGMEGDVYYPVLYARSFLNLMGHVTISYLLIDQAIVAHEKLGEIFKQTKASQPSAQTKVIQENQDAAFYAGKEHSMRFFVDVWLPQVQALSESILGGNRSAIDMYWD